MNEKTISLYKLPQWSLRYDGVKRVLDIVAGILLLTALAGPILVIAIAIRCTSAGGVFYRQKRVGKNGRIFFIYKFRTMYVDADRRGPLITSSDDARITPLGRFLRNNKLDELPQLFNVIKGDMSLVGPRPQVPRFVDAFLPEHRPVVLAIRPGITGPTQLKFRCEELMLQGRSDRERYYIEKLLPIKCQMDVDYVQQRSLSKDLQVLWETAVTVFSGIGRRFTGRQQPAAQQEVVLAALFRSYEQRVETHEADPIMVDR